MEIEEITTTDVAQKQEWESFWSDIDVETGEAAQLHPGLTQRKENLVATRQRLRELHKSDKHIDSEVLAINGTLGVIADLYYGDALYIYVYDDGRDLHPTLYVLASMEDFGGDDTRIIANLIRVERLKVDGETASYTEEHVLGNCALVWARDRKLWTMIDGVEQSMVDFRICEIDAFIVKGHETPEAVRLHSGFQIDRILPARDPYAKSEA